MSVSRALSIKTIWHKTTQICSSQFPKKHCFPKIETVKYKPFKGSEKIKNQDTEVVASMCFNLPITGTHLFPPTE